MTPPRVAAAAEAVVAVLLVAVPLAFDARPGHVGARPRYLVLLTGAAAAGLLLVAPGRRGLRGNPLRWPVLAVVVAAGASALLSAHRSTALEGFTGSYHGLVTTVALAVVFLAASAARPPGGVRRVLGALWFGAGGAVLLVGLAQLVDRVLTGDRGWDWARPAVAPHTVGSTLGNPNHLAGFLAVVLPVGIVLGLEASGRRRAVIGGMGALLLVELAATTSRGGWMGAAAGAVVLGALLRPGLGRRPAALPAALVAAAAAAVAAAGFVVLGAAGVTKVDAASVVRVGAGSTADVRVGVWGAAVRMAADHPVLGVGPDVFPVVFPAYAGERFRMTFGAYTVANGAHDLFLNTLAEQGVVGLAALVLLLGATARGLHRHWRRLGPDDGEARRLVAALAAALVAFLAQAAFNTQQLALSLSFWALLGLTAAQLAGADGATRNACRG